jgi:hypothetical protein
VVRRPRTTWKRTEWALQKAGKKGKRTSLRQNQVEELHAGLMFHIGTKEQRERMMINRKVQFLNVKPGSTKSDYGA